MPRLPRSLRRTRRFVLARRRPLAACAAAVAVLALLQATSTPPPPRTPVLTAARDLPAGTVVGVDDLTSTPFDPGSVPAGVLPDARAAIGRTTAGAVRRGEAMTDVRLVTRSLLAGHPGLVAVPVRIGDPGVVRLLRTGDRVDLVAADPQGERAARTVAQDVVVLALPRSAAQAPGALTGALVLVGVPGAEAGDVAQAAVSAFLSVVLTR
jgi:Flp pilus assembly protein CpaB